MGPAAAGQLLAVKHAAAARPRQLIRVMSNSYSTPKKGDLVYYTSKAGKLGTYRVVFSGSTKYGPRVKIEALDGSFSFWAAMDAVQRKAAAKDASSASEYRAKTSALRRNFGGGSYGRGRRRDGYGSYSSPGPRECACGSRGKDVWLQDGDWTCGSCM